MQSPPVSSDPFATALVELVFEKLDKGYTAEAIQAASVLTGLDATSGKAWWLFGISVDNDSDFARAINALSLHDAFHQLNDYNIPHFDLESTENSKINTPVLRKSSAIVFYSCLFVLSLAAFILAAINILSLQVAVAVFAIALTLVALFILRNALRLFVWEMTGRILHKDWRKLKRIYWRIILLSSRTVIPLQYGARIRPEPYFKYDAKTLLELQKTNKSLRVVESLHNRLMFIPSGQVRASIQKYLGLDDINFRVRTALFIISQLTICKQTLVTTLPRIKGLVDCQPTTDDIHQILETMWKESVGKAQQLVVLFCEEGKLTPWGMYEWNVTIYCSLNSLGLPTKKYTSSKPKDWRDAVTEYTLISQISSRVDQLAEEIHCVSENRNKALHVFEKFSSSLHLLEAILGDSMIDFYVDDFREHSYSIRQQKAVLSSVKQSPDGYAQLVAQCPRLIEELEEIERSFYRRKELMVAIRINVSQVEQILNELLSEISRLELELNFIFDIARENHFKGSSALELLRNNQSNYDEQILREKVAELNQLHVDMQSARRQFNHSKGRYSRVVDYEHQGVLIEAIIKIAKKYDLNSPERKARLQKAKEDVTRIRIISITRERDLSDIVELYTSATQVLSEETNQLIALAADIIEEKSKPVLEARQSLKGWMYLELSEYDNLRTQTRKLQSFLKKFTETPLNELVLKELDERLELFHRTFQSHKEYLEHLNVLSIQYSYISWRVDNIKSPKSSEYVDENAQKKLVQIEQCIAAARSGQTFSAINASLTRAENLLDQLASSIKYATTVLGSVKGMVIGDNPNVNINYSSEGTLTKRQFFELGVLFAVLCWKKNELSHRKNAYEQIEDIITSTNARALFPSDVLFYIVKDTETPYIELKRVVISCLQTRDRLSDNIIRNAGKIQASWFLVGFNIIMGINVTSLSDAASFHDDLRQTISSLRTAMVSLRITTEIRTIDDSITPLLDRGNYSSVGGVLRKMHIAFIKRTSEDAKSARS